MRDAVLITTGGTGGHMFPAVALGEALMRRGHAVVFAVDRRGERYLPPEAERVRVAARSPDGNPLRKAVTLLRLAVAIVAMSVRFVAARPKAVAALGGYASVPAGFAAGCLRVPLVLHEQNAVLGRAHRLLARFATTLALTFETTRRVPAHLPATVVGNPVRSGFAPQPMPSGEDLELLVIGGSQGARVFADVVPEALGRLDAAQRRHLRLAQQCRPEDLERVGATLRERALTFDVRPFFDDMPDRLASAHLVISRSGASSVAELLLVGRPAILVPYPHAADDHQRANADALAAGGAALVIPAKDFTAERLADELAALAARPATLERMATAARAMGRADAAERLADLVEEAIR